ncbi:TonB-dependent receptor domain-containing protein [Sphingobium scionense]
MELVGRTTLTRGGDHLLRPELGMEIAYNRLNSALDYAEDNGSGLTPIALANANSRVSELRGEAFANVTLRLGKRWTLESGMAFELSRIRVTGDAANEQSLSYWKPSAALVWSPRDTSQLRLGIRRTVDQLDFGDFAASVNQADGRYRLAAMPNCARPASPAPLPVPTIAGARAARWRSRPIINGTRGCSAISSSPRATRRWARSAMPGNGVSPPRRPCHSTRPCAARG